MIFLNPHICLLDGMARIIIEIIFIYMETLKHPNYCDWLHFLPTERKKTIWHVLGSSPGCLRSKRLGYPLLNASQAKRYKMLILTRSVKWDKRELRLSDLVVCVKVFVFVFIAHLIMGRKIPNTKSIYFYIEKARCVLACELANQSVNLCIEYWLLHLFMSMCESV